MNFNQQCYTLLKKVPKGKVTTYKAIAHALNTKAYRAVGQEMNKNKNIGVVPCHRVICSDDSLGGYMEGLIRRLSC